MATDNQSISPSTRAALIEMACRTIGVEDKGAERLRAQLDAIITRYAIDSAADQPTWPPKLARERLRKLRQSVERLMIDVFSLPEELATALNGLAPRPCDADPGFELCDQVGQSLALLNEALGTFDREFEPPTGRRANAALQSAVMIAMAAVQETTGEKLKARYDKPNGVPPVFITPAGRAMCDLLIGIDPSLNETMIANMVDKLHKDGPSRSYADAIDAPATAVALDLSLLPRRKPE